MAKRIAIIQMENGAAFSGIIKKEEEEKLRTAQKESGFYEFPASAEEKARAGILEGCTVINMSKAIWIIFKTESELDITSVRRDIADIKGINIQ